MMNTKRVASSGPLMLLSVSLLMCQTASSGSIATSRRSLRGPSDSTASTLEQTKTAVPQLTQKPYVLGGAPALHTTGELLSQELPHRLLAACMDTNSQCPSWAAAGYCAPGWNLDGVSIRGIICTASCGTCSGGAAPSPSPKPSPSPIKSPSNNNVVRRTSPVKSPSPLKSPVVPKSPSTSPSTGPTSPSSSGDAWLSQTNVYRLKHHAPSAAADATVTSHAQAWATYLAANCLFQHGGHDGEGQNLYASGGFQASWTQVIDSWYNEVSAYKFTSTPWTDNSATFSSIGHFTQLVWVDTTLIGCAMATNMACASGLQYYYVCNYAPPGNYVGDSSFYANVLPA